MGRPGYPAEFRRKVLDLLAAGRSVASVAHDLDVSDQTIYNWRRQDRIDRGLQPGLSTAEKSELAEAKKRIAELTPSTPSLTGWHEQSRRAIQAMVSGPPLPGAEQARQTTSKGFATLDTHCEPASYRRVSSVRGSATKRHVGALVGGARPRQADCRRARDSE